MSGWWEQASCRGLDQRLWFPIDDRAGGGFSAAVAQRICARCPVRNDCLTEALADPMTTGVWAGTTDVQRARMRVAVRSQPFSAPSEPPVAFAALDRPRAAESSSWVPEQPS